MSFRVKESEQVNTKTKKGTESPIERERFIMESYQEVESRYIPPNKTHN